ncbi:hypothetical protein ABNG39_07950 [Streptococcus dysgalactiae]|uniref:hypothetical protein n=1 Tax=Streptococcus dysgalactiae TaxID=1334 RepID=UPI00232B9FED|nr:hypothetical protein [Streptococcus dysgalactiae]WCE85284.1 hypothetical protein PMN45_07785 [Streptococcus dysgalactiae]WCN25284.1 hypothetical protein PP188_07795 [Streptococcus dysgalactiae]
MKKKLMLVVVLLTIGVATNVKADSNTAASGQNKFILDGPQQKVKEVAVSDFSVGDSEIKVWLPQAWSVKVSRKNTPIPNEEQNNEKF